MENSLGSILWEPHKGGRPEFNFPTNSIMLAPQKDVNESNKNYSFNHLCFQTNCVSVGALLANYGVHQQEEQQ